MYSCQAQLVNEVRKIGVIEIHVLVNIGQTQLLSSPTSRGRSGRLRTAKDVAESGEPVLKEFAMKSSVSVKCLSCREKHLLLIGSVV